MIDGLEADVVTLALAYDIDAIADKAKLLPADWQKRLPQQQRALHLDDRVPGAQGQPEGHQGLGRPGQAGRRGDHAEPEDLGRRALELPRRLGLRAQASTAATRPRRRSSSTQLYKNVPVLDSGARGSTTTFVAARHRRRAASPGRTRPSSPSRSSGRTSSRSSCPSRQHPRRAAGRAWSTRSSTSTARATVAEAYLEFLYTPEGQEIAAKNYYRPRDADGRGEVRRRSSRSSSCSPSTRPSAAGRRRRRRTSPTAASFDQIYQPRVAMRRADARSDVADVAAARRLPGLRPDAGLHACFYLVADRADPARRRWSSRPRARPGPSFWRTADDAARAGLLRLSFGAVARGAPINAVFGAARRLGARRATASRAQRLVDALVDLPFALPTAVAGIALTAHLRAERLDRALLEPLGHQGRPSRRSASSSR